MTSWILYAALVSLLCGAAAWSLERTVQRLPLRWIWAAALATSCALPILARVQSDTAPSAPLDFAVSTVGAADVLATAGTTEPGPPPAPTLAERVRLFWRSPDLPRPLDRWATLLWALLSVGAGASWIRSSVLLRSARRAWTAESLDGRRVLVSEGVGPAVVGVLRPSIVVPRWILDAPPPDRELMLRHEEEHVSARDPLLVFAARMLSVLLPWNFPLLWQGRRLRLAVEVDCDRRVLRGSRELRRYATLLVELGRRGALSRLRAVGLTEPLSFLERRIRTMTRAPGTTRAATALLAIAACALATGAWQLEAPSAADTTQLAVGRITGRVTDASSGAPLANVQVYVRDGYLGTISRATGAFVIEGVPPGTYELRAERIGLTTGSLSVTVVDGEDAAVAFELTAQAVGVDEIRSLRPGEAPRAPAPPSPDPTPARPADAPAGTPVFTPFTIRPQVSNSVEVQEALTREYPTTLRDAGIGGSVFVNLFVGAEGTVRNAMIKESSGNRDLDQAALRVAQTMRFTPALNRDEAVAVWVLLPLTFRP